MHKDISSSFINSFSKQSFENLIIGDPMVDTTNIGPIANAEDQMFL